MVHNKKALFVKSMDAVNKKIQIYKEKMDTIRESMDANDVHTDYDEEGNKGQLLGDFEKYAENLDNAQRMKQNLNRVDREHYSETIKFGSAVETKKSFYFIAAGLGDIIMDDGSKVHVISTDAPIYAKLEGKRKGDTFQLNGEEVEILDVH